MADSDDSRVDPQQEQPESINSPWPSLQTAEAAYHRLTAKQVFGRGDDVASRAMQLEALARLEALCVRLDRIRGQQSPWPY